MSSLLAPLSSSAIVRVASVLGVIFSVLAGEAVALQTSNGSRVPETADVDVASLNKHAGGQILAMPLKRIDHRGVATPSIGRRFFKADVLGVFGAAYMAECMPLSSFFLPFTLALFISSIASSLGEICDNSLRLFILYKIK